MDIIYYHQTPNLAIVHIDPIPSRLDFVCPMIFHLVSDPILSIASFIEQNCINYKTVKKNCDRSNNTFNFKFNQAISRNTRLWTMTRKYGSSRRCKWHLKRLAASGVHNRVSVNNAPRPSMAALNTAVHEAVDNSKTVRLPRYCRAAVLPVGWLAQLWH